MVVFDIVPAIPAMLEFWKRKEKHVALEWGMTNFEICELHYRHPSLPLGNERGALEFCDAFVAPFDSGV